MLSILIFFYCQFRNFLSFFKNVLYKSIFYAQLFSSRHKVHHYHIRYSLLFYCVVGANGTFLVLFCFLLIYNLYFPIERKCTFFLLNLHTKNLCFKLLFKIGFCSLYYLLLIFWSERDFCITLKFVQCYSLPGSTYVYCFCFFWLITFLDTREYVYCSCRKKFDLKNRIIILLHILINILRKKAN